MIKAIAFDLGGVLFTEGKTVAVKKLAEKYSYDKDIMLAILKSKESLDLHYGLITANQFWEWAQNQLPKNYDAQTIRKEWYDGYVLNNEMLELLKQLKANYKIIAFSGNIKERIEYLDKKYGFRKYFDLEIYSYDHHVCKPQEEFTKILLQESKLYGDEIVYIDDSAYWSKGAAAFGIKILIYKSGQIESLKGKFKILGILQ